jgi:hypothetical protein
MNPRTSNEAEHKLHAVVILRDRNPDIAIPASYVEACAQWYAALSAGDQAIAAAAFGAFNSGDFEKAVTIAEALPPVPRLP